MEYCCLWSQIGFRVFDRRTTMSRRRGQKVDLKLNLAPPPPTRGDTSRRAAAAAVSDGESSPSSCLSSDADSPEATSSMVLAACPRCLMYVMLSEDDARCPKCKSAVLLNFLHDSTTTKTTRKP
ncbi:protein GL2-INTERACTING REPRESSOR 1-like [Musa acuminata AAA Group]|uniref:protein GL2-INTERACTING REPRESSOR 1-like n=1 Tax=Musa acuminata AAA Group TaxID=214697 RepID=UPI0031CFB4CE